METTSGRVSPATAILIIILLIVGLGSVYYYSLTSTTLSDLNDEVASLRQQVSDYNALRTTIQSLQTQQQTLISQIQSLQTEQQAMLSQLQSLQTLSQNQAGKIQQLEASLENTQSELREMQNKYASLHPPMPTSTLVITASSYDSTSEAIVFTVQNTFDDVVYAQLFASVHCDRIRGGPLCDAQPMGSYTSDIIQFNPRSTTTITFKLAQVKYTYTDSIPPSHIEVYLVSGKTQLSQIYTFQFPK